MADLFGAAPPGGGTGAGEGMVGGEGAVPLQEAAESLGVHYMTAYRYVRTGVLPAEQVGHRWMVERRDLARLLDRPPVRAPRGAGRARAHRHLVERLLAGDEAGCWHTLQTALASGATPEEIHLAVLVPALVEVGRRWETGQVDVADEHRASAVALRLTGRLGPLFSRRGPNRGLVVVGCAPGERHGLASAILADVLRGRGWGVVDLGGDTPAASFARAARDARRLQAVMVGATTDGGATAVREAIAVLKAAGIGVPVLAGGAALPDAGAAAAAGADAWSGGDAGVAASALESLVGAGRPERRRPGRQ